MNFLSSGFWKFLTFTHESHPCLGGDKNKKNNNTVSHAHTVVYTMPTFDFQ